MIKVAFLGHGTVASSVIELLLKNKELIKARCGKEIKPILAMSRSDKKGAKVPLTKDFGEIINSKADIICELMGGTDAAFSYAKAVLESKTHLVTANKAMLALYREELSALAAKNKVQIGFEASVAGGLPIIKILREALAANEVKSIKGILNGTSNYILTQMQAGASFDAALKEAQDLGYAEANPELDINGQDAAAKIIILASLAFGIHAKRIASIGIDRLNEQDFAFASRFGYSIKSLAVASLNPDKSLELSVYPALIQSKNMLAKANGAINAVQINSDALGQSLYYGAGAGGKETASAVVADLMDIAQNKQMPAFSYVNEGLKLASLNDMQRRFYLRLKVADEVGVLSKIAKQMADLNISVCDILQELGRGSATLFISTHEAKYAQLEQLCLALGKESFLKDSPLLLPIEA